MAKRDWKRYRPLSLPDAMEACVEFAAERHQMSMDRIAEDMGLASKWVLYKWVAAGTIPARLIRPFEIACRCTYVTQHVAAGARKLLIDLPTGRRTKSSDVHAVQQACNDAVGALLAFVDGKAEAPATHAALSIAIERLAQERAEIERVTQPELAL